MSETTAIEWCDSTFNPWIGCTRVSPACDECYAARSTPARTLGVVWGPGEQRRRTSDDNWDLPRRWQRQAAAFQAQHGRRRRVFCASLADVFDNEVPAQWRIELLRLILETQDLDWLLLTKRIGNAATMLESAFRAIHHGREGWADNVPAHLWIGATVVNQAEADRDVPKLLRVPAAVRFLSVEPMLGPINLRCIDVDGDHEIHPLTGTTECVDGEGEPAPDLPDIDWVICGGESGPKARPMHPDWARSLRDQCVGANVPFLFKQHGEWIGVDDLRRLRGGGMPGFGIFDACRHDMATDTVRVGKKAAGRLLDGRTHDGFPGDGA